MRRQRAARAIDELQRTRTVGRLQEVLVPSCLRARPAMLLLASSLSLALAGVAAAQPSTSSKTKTLNTGQEMPFINLGGTSQAVRPGNHYSNYSEFLRQGGRGLDTALIYTDPINKQIAAAIKAHPEIPRSELFVTSKVPCPVANKNPEYSCADAADCMKRNNALLQLPWTDLTLVHEPCATPEETIARWVQMEAALAAGVSTISYAYHHMPIIICLEDALPRAP